MKKFLGGALLFAFLVCVGIETFHHHAKQDPQNCPLCLVKAQAKSKHSLTTISSAARATAQYNTPPMPMTAVSSRRELNLPARSPPHA